MAISGSPPRPRTKTNRAVTVERAFAPGSSIAPLCHAQTYIRLEATIEIQGGTLSTPPEPHRISAGSACPIAIPPGRAGRRLEKWSGQRVFARRFVATGGG